MMITKSISTSEHSEFQNITSLVQDAVKEAGIKSGMACVFVSHTTAGVTINENADPDVRRDMLYVLDKMVPWNDPNYRHAEGNTAAHVKASLMGSSAHMIVENGALQMGTWQGIYFCEFDGPRSRKVRIQVVGL